MTPGNEERWNAFVADAGKHTELTYDLLHSYQRK